MFVEQLGHRKVESKIKDGITQTRQPGTPSTRKHGAIHQSLRIRQTGIFLRASLTLDSRDVSKRWAQMECRLRRLE